MTEQEEVDLLIIPYGQVWLYVKIHFWFVDVIQVIIKKEIKVYIIPEYIHIKWFLSIFQL